MGLKYDYTGTYSRTGSTLEGKTTLLIAQRPKEKVTANKPPTYVLEVDGNGSRRYLSSLYPTSTLGRYRMEKGGTWYYLELHDDEALVTYYTTS